MRRTHSVRGIAALESGVPYVAFEYEAGAFVPGIAALESGVPYVAFEYEADAPLRQRRGRLEILCLRANRDLAIAELKPGKRDHAFALVGEPELVVRPVEGGRYEVQVLGWNTYDPKTGQVRAGRPGDIDCWLLDTDHDGKAFFARRIHFPGKGNDRQLRRFKSALARRIEPRLWDTMLSLTSAPFRRPKSGRIAVRIITTTGDEMLAVRDMPPAPAATQI